MKHLRIDLYLFFPAIILSGISLFLIISTASDLFVSQLIFMLAGCLLYLVLSQVDPTIYARFLPLGYIGLLTILAVSYLGPEIRGATRWIVFAGYQFQPSEMIKPFFIVLLSGLLAKTERFSYPAFIKIFVLFTPFFFLVFRQPDLGNAMVYAFFFLMMLIAYGLPWKVLIAAVMIALLLAPLSWTFLHDYQKNRIITFLDPGHDPKGAGYNAIQSMISIGSGGIWGLGLGRGTQSRLLFLPEYHTDFVFASLGEELGFAGGLLVLAAYLLLLSRILYRSFHAASDMERYIGIGIFSQLFIQTAINIGMNLGMVPITGITLPLVSYGGSSLLSTFVGLGLVTAIRSKDQDALVIR